MDELIRNLAPLVGGALICLVAWLDLRRTRRRPPSHDPAD